MNILGYYQLDIPSIAAISPFERNKSEIGEEEEEEEEKAN